MQDSQTYDLTVMVITCVSPVQTHARPNSRMERGAGHKIPLLGNHALVEDHKPRTCRQHTWNFMCKIQRRPRWMGKEVAWVWKDFGVEMSQNTLYEFSKNNNKQEPLKYFIFKFSTFIN